MRPGVETERKDLCCDLLEDLWRIASHLSGTHLSSGNLYTLCYLCQFIEADPGTGGPFVILEQLVERHESGRGGNSPLDDQGISGIPQCFLPLDHLVIAFVLHEDSFWTPPLCDHQGLPFHSLQAAFIASHLIEQNLAAPFLMMPEF